MAEEYDLEEEKRVEEDTTEAEEEDEGFMKGYSDEEEAEECAECGIAIKEGKKVARSIEGEEYPFCSIQCADEFEASLASEE